MIKIYHESEIVQFFQQTTNIRDYISPLAADLNRESSTPCSIKAFEDFKIYRGSRCKKFGEGSYFMTLEGVENFRGKDIIDILTVN